jgi:hypothetical protein
MSCIPTPLASLLLWQMGVTLPSTITVDVSQHQPTQLPCPDGWLVMRLNGRVWIAKESKNIVMLDAAQYGTWNACWHSQARFSLLSYCAALRIHPESN